MADSEKKLLHILEVTRQKASNLQSMDGAGDAITKAVKLLQASINPSAQKLVNDLTESLRSTIEWMVERKRKEEMKENIQTIKTEINDDIRESTGTLDDLFNASQVGITMKESEGSHPTKDVKIERTYRSCTKIVSYQETIDEEVSTNNSSSHEDSETENAHSAWSDEESEDRDENSETYSSDFDKKNAPQKQPSKKKRMSSRNFKSTKCDECGKEFTTAGTLRVHKLTHLDDETAKKPYVCDQCDKRFTQAGSLSVHKRKHLKKDDPKLLKFKRIWKCKVCGKEYSHHSGLWAHEKTHLDQSQRKRNFKCQHCGRAFTHKAMMKGHELLHTGDLRFKCELCPRQFNTKQMFNEHMDNHEKGTVRLWSGFNISRNHKCTLCPKRFRKDYELAAHRGMQSCLIPDDTVGSSSDEDEIEVITKQIFPCQQCKKVYTSRRRLERHLNYYHAERPFPCTLCELSYKLRHTLAYHMKMVHGEGEDTTARVPRPFKCEHCPKSFTTEFALEEHKSIHAGPSSFKCSLCSDEFASITQLVVHKKTVHDPKPFECRRCGKKFEEMDQLTEHKRLSKLMKQAGYQNGCSTREPGSRSNSAYAEEMEVVELQ